MTDIIKLTQDLIDNPKGQVTDNLAQRLLSRIAELEKELQWVVDTCNHPTKGISIYDLDRIEGVIKND